MTDYSPTNWQDGVTDITATALNNADLGVDNAHAEIDVLNLTGFVAAFPMTTAPSGWLKCNAQEVSRTTYANLFAVIGITYGAGNGTTTFNLPDYRGLFLRGLDENKGYDTGRQINANAQTDDVKAHTDHQYHEDAVNTTQNFATSGGSSAKYQPGALSDNTSNCTGNESRPVNKAVIWCIKT